jgi:hypothetical protein
MKRTFFQYRFLPALLFISFACKTDPPPRPYNNQPSVIAKVPVANAGPDQVIKYPANSATLDGSASYDSLKYELSYTWALIKGPAGSTLRQINQAIAFADYLTEGVYTYELKVTSTGGHAFDTTTITVLNADYCQKQRDQIIVGLTEIASLPTEYSSISAAGNKLIIRDLNLSDNIKIYDVATKTMISTPIKPERTGMAIAAAGGKIFFAAGAEYVTLSNSDYGNFTSRVDIYDIAANTWTSANLSEARADCKAAVAGNKIFFAGGLNDKIRFSDKVDIYDLQTNTWSGTILAGGARAIIAAETAANKIFFCGGYKEYENPTGFGYTYGNPVNTIDIFDINTGQWSLSSMKINRGAFSSVVLDDKVYLAGGYDIREYPTKDVEIIDAKNMNSSMACLSLDNQPYIAASKTDKVVFFPFHSANSANINFDLFNKTTGLWSIGILPNIPGWTNFCSVATISDEVYLAINKKLYKLNL